MVNRTLLIIKPDAMRHKLAGQIIWRMERAGLEIVECHMGTPEKGFWDCFYHDLKNRIPEDAYEEHIEFMNSGPVMCLVLVGDDARDRVRKLLGVTDPAKAAPGTIRGDFGSTLPETICHASDSETSFEREYGLVRALSW